MARPRREDFAAQVRAGLRQAPEASSGRGSWWLGRSREELDAEAARRAREMSATREGRRIYTTPIDLPK